jgi:hypothetical protein
MKCPLGDLGTYISSMGCVIVAIGSPLKTEPLEPHERFPPLLISALPFPLVRVLGKRFMRFIRFTPRM